MSKKSAVKYSENEVRSMMLRYFYDKNRNSKSRIGKKNSAAISISIIRSDLKELYGLKQEQVLSNLTYLISQGWIDEKHISKSFSTGKGTVIPSVTTYFVISAAGIDKIECPSEFTRDKFSGIKIEATGQNIITLGDGNQINSKFENVGNALNELKEAVKVNPNITEEAKIDYVTDIDSIQGQLSKPNPNKGVIKSLWEGLNKLVTIDGVIEIYNKTEPFIKNLIS